MLEGNFIAMTVVELKEQITDYYKQILINNADEILMKGNVHVPVVIIDGGMNSLELDELVEVSQEWFDEEHADVEVVLLFDEKSKELTILKHPYLEKEKDEHVDVVEETECSVIEVKEQK